MTTLSVTESKIIRRPIDVVRAHFSDIRHHFEHNVHPAYPLAILAEGDRTFTYKQRSKVFGRTFLDVYVLEARTDGTVYLKVIEGPTLGTEQIISFRALGDTETEVSVDLRTTLKGFDALMTPLVRRYISGALKTTLEEDRIDIEINGYRPPAAKKVV